MQISIDTVNIRRTPSTGSGDVGPKTPPAKITGEEEMALRKLLSRIEDAVGEEEAKMIELAEITFSQEEKSAEWVAAVRVALKETDLGTMETTYYIKKGWLKREKEILEVIALDADTITNTARIYRDLSEMVERINKRIATAKAKASNTL